MTIDEFCMEKGIAESHSQEAGIENAGYKIMGCYDCTGKNPSCQSYFPIDPKSVTLREVVQYMRDK